MSAIDGVFRQGRNLCEAARADGDNNPSSTGEGPLSGVSKPGSWDERRGGTMHLSWNLLHPSSSQTAGPPLTLVRHADAYQRPHVCPYCAQSYIRPTHLTAHLRTHMSEEAKRYVCSVEGCGKRFWTGTHARRHEELHDEPMGHIVRLFF